MLHIDHTGFKPPFPKGPAALVGMIHIAHITSANVLHETGQIPVLLRRDQQMHMVGHQHIGVYRHFILILRLLNAIQIKPVIRFCKKAGIPIISSLCDMVGITSQVHSWLPCHRAFLIKSFSLPAWGQSKFTLTPFHPSAKKQASRLFPR